MASIFDTSITKGVRSGQIPARTQEAREWYRQTAKEVGKVNERKLFENHKDRMTSTPIVGNMYLFQYDAKHKDTLPYWDRLPLIFPFRSVKGGFYGINLHYLPLQMRAKLMDGLYDLANNTRYDESTRLNLNYQLLVGAAKTRYISPCVKMYLTSHVQSRFMYIYPSEWDIALFLPLARFEKRTANHVHAQSRKMVMS